MNVHSHYENLKVSRDAPPEVIRAAYKALSMLWHPDRSIDPRAAEIMKTINIAHDVLSNPLTRREHDEWLAAEELKWTLSHPTIQYPKPGETWHTPKAKPASAATPEEPKPEPEPVTKRGRAFDIDEDRLKEGLERADERRLRSMREHLICLVFRSFRTRHFR